MTTAAEMERRAAEFRRDYAVVREQLARVIVGHDTVLDGVLTCLLCGGHALLEGVPGLGKTLLVRTLADATSLVFARIQFTPDLMPADIVGTTDRRRRPPECAASCSSAAPSSPTWC